MSTPPAEATRQPPMTLDALIHQSARIIEATVVGYDPTAGDTLAPATRVELHVIAALGPDTGDHKLTLHLPEGIEANGAAWAGYEGVPTFAPGETYLLFLRRDPWRISPVVHWGAAHLRRAEIAGRAVYVDMQGACAADLDDDGVTLGPRVTDPPPVPGRDTWSSLPPQPSAITRCLPAAELRARLTARIHHLGWQPAPCTSPPRPQPHRARLER
ncbi:MAG: hypothetical protein R3F65_06680 [bacterium]